MNLVTLAMRIARLRKERKLTLQQCAERCGLTASVLSKVENFRVTPSLPALSRIAAALGVSMAELVEGLDAHPQIVVVRANEREEIHRDVPKSPFTYFALAYPRAQKSMDPFIVEIPPGVERESALAHEGEEFCLVLQGSLNFEYGEETIPLAEGDAFYADGTIAHRLRNTGDDVAKVLIVYAFATGKGE